MRYFGLYSMLIVLLVAGCRKKTYPEDRVVNDPLFYFSGEINAHPVAFKAGVNNFYMFSASTRDANGVYNFLGALRRTDCSDCDNAFVVQINDKKISNSGRTADVQAAIQPGRYPLFSEPMVSYTVAFSSTFNKTAASYLWNFGDGQTSTLPNPTHTYTRSGTYNVELRIQSAESCISISRNRVHVDKNAFNAAFTVLPAGGNTVNFVPSLRGGIGPFEFLWNFGDGTTSTASTPQHSYKTKGSYPVTLRVRDAAGTTATFQYNYVSQDDVSSCNANMQVAAMGLADPTSEMGLGAVCIRWQEPGGRVFTSQSAVQDAGNYFEIVSVEDFDTNENGYPTKKLKVRLKCNLFDGKQHLSLDKVEAVIAVAY